MARTFNRVPLGFIFATHTLRAQQIVTPTAKEHGLPVVQVPAAGSRVEGIIVNGAAPSSVAIVPLADALSRLPEGSVALVGVNSDNVFGILHRLGVPGSHPLVAVRARTILRAVPGPVVLPRRGVRYVVGVERAARRGARAGVAEVRGALKREVIHRFHG